MVWTFQPGRKPPFSFVPRTPSPERHPARSHSLVPGEARINQNQQATCKPPGGHNCLTLMDESCRLAAALAETNPETRDGQDTPSERDHLQRHGRFPAKILRLELERGKPVQSPALRCRADQRQPGLSGCPDQRLYQFGLSVPLLSRTSTVLCKYSILIHRWVGVAFFVLFAVWFLSGIVMMCWYYPGVDTAGRLASSGRSMYSSASSGPKELSSLPLGTER